MKRIGVISDTHGHWDDSLELFFVDCDEIWHAGDIGNIQTAEDILRFKHLKAVHGNIDDIKVRSIYPKILEFLCEEVSVIITHIGGYPGRYESDIMPMLKSKSPNIFICGHSHILKVIFDKKYNLLHINPGAAGKSGFHHVRTAVKFTIDKIDIKDMEILEIPRSYG